MEKNMSKALQLFSTVMDQIENNVARMVDPVGKINYAYASVTSLVFGQYLDSPDKLIEKYDFAIDELSLLTRRCYVLLDILGAAYPGEVDDDVDIPDEVYLVYYLFNMVDSIIGFFDESQTIEIPVWYER
ncbi:hypothetical protein [Pedobacter immunditicola]|uniref:hypothetical protein n=1 Tax=Pedobacter immunditicola TaxID=3133440 RepID=UPI0030B2EBE8